MTSTDVAADYLFELRQAIRKYLTKTLGDFFTQHEDLIRWCFTVPAIFNDTGRAALCRAIQRAGYVRDESDKRLLLVAEPETIILYCSRTGLINMKQYDAAIVIDCGPGTMDLIAYETATEKPFTVTECTAGTGDSCGSTALDRNFSALVRKKVDAMGLPEGSKTAARVYAKCILDFSNRIKTDFRNNGQKWAVDVGIEAEFPDAGIEEGFMIFTNEEIHTCFEPVMKRILQMIRDQIIAVQAQNRTLQNIILCGEFGTSEYLIHTIKMSVPEQFRSSVVRPMDTWTCAIKGATQLGLQKSLHLDWPDSPW